MKKSYELILALLLGVMPILVFAQVCSKSLSISKYLEEKDSIQCQKIAFVLEECGKKQDSLALVYHYLGVWNHKKGNYLNAIQFNLKAIAIREKNNLSYNENGGKSHHNLGVCYKLIDNNEKAKTHLTIAVAIYESIQSDREVRSLLELGQVYNRLGDYNRALQFLDLGNQKARKYKDTMRLYKSYVLYGFILHEKKRYQSAIDSLFLAEFFFNNHVSNKTLTKCYINLARSHYALKHYQKSIFYGELVVNMFSEYISIGELGISLNNLGMVYLKIGDVVRAKNNFEIGVKIGKIHELNNLIAQSLNNLGEVYLLSGEEEKALWYFHNALKKEIKEFVTEDIFSTPSKKIINTTSSRIDLLDYLVDKATTSLLVYKKNKKEKYRITCLETYKQCDYLIDLLRQEHTNQESKLFWREKVLPIYEKAIEASYVAKDYDSAFFFFEKSKAILLLDAMLNAEALNGIKNDELILQEKKMRKIRLNAQEELDNANESEKKTALEKIVHLNNEWDALMLKISEDYPNYHAVKYEKTVTTPLTVRKAQLKDGKTALLHYFLGKEKTWLYVLSNEKISIKELGTAKRTTTLVRNYLSFFENSFAIINDPKGYEKAAFELYKYLLAPAELIGMKNLIIIPDGILGFVPFEALITKPSEGGNLSQMNYLIKEYSLRLSFSATILGKQNNNAKFNQDLLAFAPFSEVKNDSEYPALPFSADELFSIEQSIGGQFYKGKKATKATFLSQMPNFSIVHLSTHATANANNGKPFIVFSDSLLTLQELYGLHLSANLVVLSACETNIGEVKSGEGIFSLSRGFTYAGAKSIIASLWNVNTGSTGEIFPAFYENLKKGELKSTALRKAKLDYINTPAKIGQVKTPYDWAGFVLVGNNENISLLATSSSWIIWSILGGIILLILVKKFVR